MNGRKKQNFSVSSQQTLTYVIERLNRRLGTESLLVASRVVCSKEDIAQSKVRCMGDYHLCDALSRPGLNPVRLAYDPTSAGWPPQQPAPLTDCVVCQQSWWPGFPLRRTRHFLPIASTHCTYLRRLARLSWPLIHTVLNQSVCPCCYSREHDIAALQRCGLKLAGHGRDCSSKSLEYHSSLIKISLQIFAQDTSVSDSTILRTSCVSASDCPSLWRNVEKWISLWLCTDWFRWYKTRRLYTVDATVPRRANSQSTLSIVPYRYHKHTHIHTWMLSVHYVTAAFESDCWVAPCSADTRTVLLVKVAVV